MERLRRVDDLKRPAAGCAISCAQNFVAAQYLAERFFECLHVEMTIEKDGARYVVSSEARFELVQEPHALLREGKRQITLALDADDGWCGDAFGLALQRVDGTGHSADGRALEEHAERRLDFEQFADAGSDLRNKQGMRAVLKEIVFNTDALCVQNL